MPTDFPLHITNGGKWDKNDLADVVGMWNGELADGGLDLQLNSDGSASLIVDDSTKYNMTWTYDEGIITLTQNDIPMYGYYVAGKYILLDMNDNPFVLRKDSSDTSTETAEAAETQSAAENVEYDISAYETLEKGSKGDKVKELQNYLKALGYLDGTVDGSYGNGTAGAVSAFQEAEGLEVTGVADPLTQAHLFAKEIPYIPPVEICSVDFDESSYNRTPELTIRFINNGDETVDRVDFIVECYDVYGDPITSSTYRTSMFTGTLEETVKSGKKSSSSTYFPCYGYDGLAEVRIAITRYHIKDGSGVDIAAEDQYWQTFKK